MEDKLTAYKNPAKTETELKRRVRKAWAEIPVSTLAKCAASMPTRLQAVIDRAGAAAPK